MCSVYICIENLFAIQLLSKKFTIERLRNHIIMTSIDCQLTYTYDVNQWKVPLNVFQIVPDAGWASIFTIQIQKEDL